MIHGLLIGIPVGIVLEVIAAKIWGKYKISALINKEKAVLEAKLEALKKAL